MLQFDLQFYEELTVAWVRTVKFISGAFFWPTGHLVLVYNYIHWLTNTLWTPVSGPVLRTSVICGSSSSACISSVQ